MIITIFLPIIAGIILMLLPDVWFHKRKYLIATVSVLFCVSMAMTFFTLFGYFAQEMKLFRLVGQFWVSFHVDDVSKIFATITTIVMCFACIFSFGYMAHEEKEKRYFGFYLITYGVLMGLDFSGNLITMYGFYELMTVMTVPLVMHNQSKEAIMAGLKYVLYSFFGAYMALFGIYFLSQYADLTVFMPGGSLIQSEITQHRNLLLFVAFAMIMGFGVKAGMFPFHAWLPTAHPVAPAPASAVLSAIIVKGGVLAMLRVVHYVIGADFLRGTWVQTIWLLLTLITILMGSCLAYKEKGLKKRLAYSTVSNVSYIVFGIALLNPVALTGAFLHIIFHALIKATLFLAAGAIIVTTGKTKIAALKGIGKQMPVLLWSFTLASLALVGIPPTCGVVSKWYLAVGAMDAKIAVFSWLGPVILLVSALLTAGYLLSISINGFLEGAEVEKKEPQTVMLIPVVLLAILTLLLGLYPTPVIGYILDIVATVL